jgi:hypothetical protein
LVFGGSRQRTARSFKRIARSFKITTTSSMNVCGERRFMKSSRNNEYDNWNKKGPDSQLLVFVITNPQVRRTEDEIAIGVAGGRKGL